MAPQGAKDPQKSTADVASDLWQLIKEYAKQETIDPLRSLGNFLKWGVPGAILLTTGLVFGVMAVLRVLQIETGRHLSGSWNFVPYVVALLFVVIVVVMCIRAITRPNRQQAGV